MQMNAKGFALIAGGALMASCQTPNAPAAAVLENADHGTMAALHAALASAVGRAQVEIGPGDLTQSSTIAVLPPPLGPGEDRSLATPDYFDLMWVDGKCVLVAQETGAQFALDGVSCRKL